MNDRNRVERLLPLWAILDVLENGVRNVVEKGVQTNRRNPLAEKCIADTKSAMDPILAGMTADDTRKIARRVRRAHDMGLGRFRNETARLDVYSYGLYYMLKVLSDADIFVLGNDAYAAAINGFLAALAENELAAHEDARAKSQGRMMLQTYQALGYFLRVPWPEDL